MEKNVTFFWFSCHFLTAERPAETQQRDLQKQEKKKVKSTYNKYDMDMLNRFATSSNLVLDKLTSMWSANDTEILRALQLMVTYNLLLSILLTYIFFRDCTIYYRKIRKSAQGRPKRSVDKAVREGDFVSLLQIAATTPADIVGLREDESVDRQPIQSHYFNHNTYTRFYEANFGKIRSEMVAYCPEVFDRLRAVRSQSFSLPSQQYHVT